MKHFSALVLACTFCTYIFPQNVGINVTNPLTELQVDSTIKVGKDSQITSLTPGRKNLLKFGDASYTTIGEENTDDLMGIHYGNLVLSKSAGSTGSGYIGIETTTPSANLDINGTLRLRPNAAAGRLLTSDANGNAIWQAPAPATVNVAFVSKLSSDRTFDQQEHIVNGFTEVTDETGNNFEPITGVFTAPVAGMYQFIGRAAWGLATGTENTSYTNRIYVEHAGVNDVIAQTTHTVPNSNYVVALEVTALTRLSVGDKVRFTVSQSYSSSLTLIGNGATRTAFSGAKIY